MRVEIDPNSGFCFGVVNAINKAEEYLKEGESLYCIGDIVHNAHEVERLKKEGLKTIDHDEFEKIHDCKVLLRAHGEPPLTYEIAKKNNIEIIDASCPVVLNLQKRILKAWEEGKKDNVQIVIYGKKGHAEVNGLVGQTNGEAIVLEKLEDANSLDFTRPICLFSQTTKPLSGFELLSSYIKEKTKSSIRIFDTVCRKVSNRIPELREFAKSHDLIMFVSGAKSSNGKMLFNICREENKNTIFIQGAEEINLALLEGAEFVGICGATSTPRWVMDEVYEKICKANNI
ncbi:MAG: 4-hydroxy-3-methylbut-2-enyl diphosphate reductase [Marinifilaceae bacterium]